ncbi:MAG: TldD/PmbA family protein [Bacillota bacterium]
MIPKDVLQRVLDSALKRGGDFAEVFVEKKKTAGIGMEDSRVEKVVSGLDIGVGIRVISGDNTAYAYTNNLEDASLERVADVVARAAKGPKKERVLDFTSWHPKKSFPSLRLPEAVPVEEKVNLVRKIDQTARSIDDRIRQVAIGYADVMQEVIIANSEGNYVEDERIRTRLSVNVIAAEGHKIQTGYEAIGGFSGFESVENAITEGVATRAAERALLMLKAKPAPAGRMPVVLAAEAGGTMVHEACGHGLEADLVQKGLSVYGAKKGQLVANPLISVVDDATVPGRYGSYRFDDEGTPSRRTVLIRNGELHSYLYDFLTANKEKVPSTGNGRRESYQDKPIPRMSNTMILPGSDNPEQILRETRTGLYVKKMGGGQVNTTNGDFVFDVAEGYLIQDGVIKSPVRGATLTGNGPEVLKIVDMVGKDLGFAIGTCGKDGQGVPVADAQPTLRIPELIVGGIID